MDIHGQPRIFFQGSSLQSHARGGGRGGGMTTRGSYTIEQYYKEQGGKEANNPRHWNNPLNENIIPEEYGVKMSQTEWLEKLQEMKGG